MMPRIRYVEDGRGAGEHVQAEGNEAIQTTTIANMQLMKQLLQQERLERHHGQLSRTYKFRDKFVVRGKSKNN